jgi:threonine dehydrogenase-like Zn-dependent dehydrogenase
MSGSSGSSMSAWGAPHRSAPAWDRERLVSTVADQLFSGTLATDRMPVRTFPFAEAVEAYRSLDQHPADAVKVALSYHGAERSARP